MPEKKKNEKGCLFYVGIAGILVAVLCIVIGLSIGMTVKRNIDKYTDSMPTKFIDQPIDPNYAEAVRLKIETFQSAVRDGVDEIEISLNADEINTLIRTHENLSMFKDKVRISFHDQKLKGELSLPLKELKTGILDNRYLNGMAEFRIIHENDNLNIQLEKLKINELDLPAQFMANLSQVNFASEFNKSPNTNAAMQYLLGMDIKGDNLIIKAGRGK